MRALSRLGAFNQPERAGVYVGFLAGVLAANPDRSEWLIAETLKMARARPLGGGARHRLFRAAALAPDAARARAGYAALPAR